MVYLPAIFSSKSDDWATPQAFFDKLNAIYDFTVDVCASAGNAKCFTFFTREQDGLQQEWTGVAFMNPPYGKTIRAWIEKASRAALEGKATVVCLLPVRTDTLWFQELIYNKPNVTVEFVKGRLRFGDAKDTAPFPSMVVVFHKVAVTNVV